MSEASSKCGPVISGDLPSATSLQESECGVTPCDKPGGPTVDLFGQALVPVNRSAPPAKAMSSQMSATYGRRGSNSSASAALSLSLASRLQVVTHSLGSTMFALTWKQRVTPSGRSIPALRATARRTSGSDCIGWGTPQTANAERSKAFGEGRTPNLEEGAQLASWPTPQNRKEGGGDYSDPEKAMARIADGAHQINLSETALLASWPTPDCQNARDGEVERAAAYGAHAVSLHHMVQRASWPTPQAREQMEDSESKIARGMHAGLNLPVAAQLAAWATPQAQDCKQNGDRPNSAATMNIQLARLTDSGATPNGSPAGTEKRGPQDRESTRSSWPTPAARDDHAQGATHNPKAQSSSLATIAEKKAPPNNSRGQLNPALSRWLMGLPPEWCEAAILAHRQIKARKRG
jgi:hypothetical protein